MPRRFSPLPFLVCLLALGAAPTVSVACHFASHFRLMEERMGMEIPPKIRAMLHLMEEDHTQVNVEPEGATTCAAGMAGPYACQRIDLLAVLPMAAIGGGNGNDIWGWTDLQTGREWALMGRTNGVAFVDVTDPTNPVYVGNLPTQTIDRTWRDVKVYADHAFIVADFVADGSDRHGIQVFDLTRLRTVSNPPVTFDPEADLAAHYDEFGSAHNIVINEDTGFAYVTGASEQGQLCGSGLHIVDVSDPTQPTFAGCFGDDGYTHDAQCVVYDGPDLEHVGKEICFASNTDTLTIVDVTDKSSPVQLSRTGYEDSGYTHQGWLTPDHRYFVLDDELDEVDPQIPDETRTYTWDLENLDDAQLVGTHVADGVSRDHNQYVRDSFTFQANYQRGLRVLDITQPETGTLTEVAYFDTHPETDDLTYAGAWSVYPFFESGTVIVSDMNRGLFVLRVNLPGVIFEDGFEDGDPGAWDGAVTP